MKNLEQRSLQWVFLNLVVAAVYFGMGQLSDMLSILKSQASPIWAPSGFMVAAVLIFGYKVFPGVFLGTFAINVWYFQRHRVLSYFPASIGIGVFSLVESGSCAWLLKHPVGFRNGSLHWKVMSNFMLVYGDI